jgi:hypothetical protein
MISLKLAQKLKSTGLAWKPQINDFFAIPERGMDSRVFVISDMPANIEFRMGEQVVAFQGASEWALDTLITSEAVWMPSETQLRQALEEVLVKQPQPTIRLISRMGWSRCEIDIRGKTLMFESSDACDAYGEGLLHLLLFP